VPNKKQEQKKETSENTDLGRRKRNERLRRKSWEKKGKENKWKKKSWESILCAKQKARAKKRDFGEHRSWEKEEE
jgi:hypothetical protein